MTPAYSARFLGHDLALPASAAPSADLVLLDYTHFSVRLRRSRRLAELTAVNIDGASLTDVPRGDDWHLDDRVPAEHQAGPELYARNDLDRGHLVRRRDPVWGSPELARKANTDTFAYTNAAPQAAQFNQSKALWLGLEDHVLAHADAYDARLTVFTGPVLAPLDPVYRGMRLPLRFWKVTAWDAGERLAAAAFVLDQSPMIDELEAARPTPPLGPFRTFQVGLAQVRALTGLDWSALEPVDRFHPRPGFLPDVWTPLESTRDIRL